MKFENPETAQLFADFRESILQWFSVPNAYLPADYHSKRKCRSLASVEAQYQKSLPPPAKPDMETSVKFDSKRNIVSGSPARLAAIEHYRKQVEGNIDNLENDDADAKFEPFMGISEDKLYRAELNFAVTLINAGIMEPFEDNGHFDE